MVLPSWAQMSGQDKCPACVDITPVSAAITGTGMTVALGNHWGCSVEAQLRLHLRQPHQ